MHARAIDWNLCDNKLTLGAIALKELIRFVPCFAISFPTFRCNSGSNVLRNFIRSKVCLWIE